MKCDGFKQKRDVAKTGDRTTVNRKTLRPFELAINQRDVQLQSKSRVNLISSHELRNRAVLILAGGICDFASVDLDGPEASELLADGCVPSGHPRCRC